MLPIGDSVMEAWQGTIFRLEKYVDNVWAGRSQLC